MTNYIILLTGDHPTIPIAEIKALIEDKITGPFEVYDQVMRIDLPTDLCKEIAERCAYVRACYKEVLMCKAELDVILSELEKVNLPQIINQTFAVRVRRIKEYSRHLSTVLLEKRIGEILTRRFKARVDLRSPKILFQGILTDGIFFLGVLLYTSRRKEILKRGTKYKPFTHPSALDPRMARAMINMARVDSKSKLLDPFSGTGTVIIESALIGMESIGIDIDKRMVYGSLRNIIKFQAYDKCSLIVADATRLPFRGESIDAIVTDPPYGRSASTYGYGSLRLIEKLISDSAKILKKKGTIVLMHPKEYFKYVRNMQLSVLEKHVIEVHSGLTRVISVLRNC